MIRKIELAGSGVWRNDLQPEDTATVTSVAICAEDAIETGDPSLRILHVFGFPHGRGFMASVRTAGRMANSAAIWGDTQAEYDRALRSGRELHEEEVRNLERIAEEYGLPRPAHAGHSGRSASDA